MGYRAHFAAIIGSWQWRIRSLNQHHSFISRTATSTCALSIDNRRWGPTPDRVACVRAASRIVDSHSLILAVDLSRVAGPHGALAPLASGAVRLPLPRPLASALTKFFLQRKRCAKQLSCWALPVLGPNQPANANLMPRAASLRDIRPRSSPRGRSDGQKRFRRRSDGQKVVTRAECLGGFVGVAVVMSLISLQ